MYNDSMSIDSAKLPLFWGSITANFPVCREVWTQEDGLGVWDQASDTIELRNGLVLNTALTQLWLEFCFAKIQAKHPQATDVGEWIPPAGGELTKYKLPNNLIVQEEIGNRWLAYIST